MARKPRFAVILLNENADVGGFFNLLITHGYSNVTFVTSLAEHSEVKKLLNNNVKCDVNTSTANDVSSSCSTSSALSSSSSHTVSTPTIVSSTSIIMNRAPPSVSDTDTRGNYKPNAEFINCKLCDNKIMCSRLSNLTNHVRRHSSVKQYSCIYCPYQHNEMSKVRTHMAGQHGDTITAPNDNLTPELQKIWCAYMEKCFPGYLESQGKTGRHAAEVFGGRTLARMENSSSSTSVNNIDEEVVPLDDKLHNCIECGDAVSGDPESSIEPFTDHIQLKHAYSCIPYKCGECEFVNSQEYEVRGHISTEHAMIASIVDVTEGPVSSNYPLFISKFFPSVDGCSVDDTSDLSLLVKEKRLSAEDLIGGNHDITSMEGELKAESLLGGCVASGDVDACDENQAVCSVCSDVFEIDDIEGMMCHAKDHYCLKRFECPSCSFGSNEFEEVEKHVKTAHSMKGVEMQVIDHNSELMQQAWMQTMKCCFSDVASRILSKEKVSNLEQTNSSETGMRPRRKKAKYE